jgi:hypothetical protein
MATDVQKTWMRHTDWRPIHPTPFSSLTDEDLERLAYASEDPLVRELAKRWFDTLEVVCPECDAIFETNL